MTSRILFVSGHQEDARRLSRMLHSLPLVLDHVSTTQQMCANLQRSDYNVVLTEATLPDGSWRDVLHLARKHSGELEVIVTDLHADARLWSEALNMGAYDLVSQPFYEPEVRRILYYACSRSSEPRAMAV
jgi:DNA-binding NtrC family response regulator